MNTGKDTERKDFYSSTFSSAVWVWTFNFNFSPERASSMEEAAIDIWTFEIVFCVH